MRRAMPDGSIYEENRGMPHWRKYRYGLTPEAFEALWQKQGGLCAICRLPPETGRDMCVDHDEETEIVRGLLCSECNLGIGLLRHQPVMLRRAAEYIEQSTIPARSS